MKETFCGRNFGDFDIFHKNKMVQNDSIINHTHPIQSILHLENRIYTDWFKHDSQNCTIAAFSLDITTESFLRVSKQRLPLSLQISVIYVLFKISLYCISMSIWNNCRSQFKSLRPRHKESLFQGLDFLRPGKAFQIKNKQKN